MESPTITPDHPTLQENQYKIRTKNLSYRLSKRIDEYFSKFFWNKERACNPYILKGVNCEAKPGEITAIAGPSGAGKTTLLEILAGMVPLSRVSGYVLVNEQPVNVRQFRRMSGYVTQDEALFPFLTVEETLMYSTRLRLHGDTTRAVKRVRELLKELGLEHVANVRIGGETNRGISGGEKRRVSIGVDLVHDPAVLLIDEPTSGLDSSSAFHVASLLKTMATSQGKTIVLTIHQPGFKLLELFDKIVLLSKGTVLHHGSVHHLEHRLRISGHSIPRYVNVLEFAIEVAEALVIKTEGSEIEYTDTKKYQHVKKTPSLRNKTITYYSNSQIKEVSILVQRFSSNIYRTKQLFAARTLQSVIAGLVLGNIFMGTANDPRGFKLQTQLGFFAFSLTFLLASTTEGLPIYLQERKIMMRETSRGAYRISSYVISNTLVFLPFLFVAALLYAIPVYWLVGLRRETDGFLYFSLVVWLVVLMSNSFVSCFSALVPNFVMGNSLIAGIMGSYFLFSGYFISKDEMPKYWIFMHYLSLFKYPFECFIINEYGGEKGKKRCLESVGGQCYLYGDGFLMQQGLKESQKWTNIGIMLGFIIGYRLLCFLILWYRFYRTRS